MLLYFRKRYIWLSNSTNIIISLIDIARSSNPQAIDHDYVPCTSSNTHNDPPPQYDQVFMDGSGRVAIRELTSGEDPYHVHVTPVSDYTHYTL